MKLVKRLWTWELVPGKSPQFVGMTPGSWPFVGVGIQNGKIVLFGETFEDSSLVKRKFWIVGPGEAIPTNEDIPLERRARFEGVIRLVGLVKLLPLGINPFDGEVVEGWNVAVYTDSIMYPFTEPE